jgi:hypothetical protein
MISFHVVFKYRCASVNRDDNRDTRMNKWDFIKLKSFCTTKEMVSKLKRPPTEWEKYLPAIHQTKD